VSIFFAVGPHSMALETPGEAGKMGLAEKSEMW
jgi:hypothetical protein